MRQYLDWTDACPLAHQPPPPPVEEIEDAQPT